jgi:hypothetical protein
VMVLNVKLRPVPFACRDRVSAVNPGPIRRFHSIALGWLRVAVVVRRHLPDKEREFLCHVD